MAKRYSAIFLDDGGVISDNEARAPQWRRLLGEFLPPILGGTSEQWAEANAQIMDGFYEGYIAQVRVERATHGRALLDYATYYRDYRLTWLRRMCERVGVEPPIDEEDTLDLASRAIAYCTHRVVAPQPRVAEAIRYLRGSGYTLYTASGEARAELDGYLSALDVRELFRGLYGGDLVNTLKEGPEYYERVLAHSGEAPESCLFVDDAPIVLPWIRQAGAHSALVRADPPPDSHADHYAPSLWDLSQTL